MLKNRERFILFCLELRFCRGLCDLLLSRLVVLLVLIILSHKQVFLNSNFSI